MRSPIDLAKVTNCPDLIPYCNIWWYFWNKLVDSQTLNGETAPQSTPTHSKNSPGPRNDVPERFGEGRENTHFLGFVISCFWQSARKTPPKIKENAGVHSCVHRWSVGGQIITRLGWKLHRNDAKITRKKRNTTGTPKLAAALRSAAIAGVRGCRVSLRAIPLSIQCNV